MEKFIVGLFVAFFGIIIMLFFGLIMAIVVMLMWNYLAPTFNLPELSYIQAYVLYALCGTLFKSSTFSSKS